MPRLQVHIEGREGALEELAEGGAQGEGQGADQDGQAHFQLEGEGGQALPPGGQGQDPLIRGKGDLLLLYHSLEGPPHVGGGAHNIKCFGINIR